MIKDFTKKRISVLGSTGSIGTQTLDVAENLGCEVETLTAHSSIDLLEKQIRKFKPSFAVCTDKPAAETRKSWDSHTKPKALGGEHGLFETIKNDASELIVNGIVGMAGTRPTIEIIKAHKTAALANKEAIVTAGEYICDLAKKENVTLISVDSEHSAIFQCLETRKGEAKIKRLLLTASGGPFFGKTAEELKDITPEKALAHPTWKMGKKITIDSATLMNKGLEIIEAVRLFGVDESKVKVVIHRESIVHSAVEFEDNAIIAQLGLPDMRVPIQYAITYPDRKPSPAAELDLASLAKMTFYEPDEKTFRSLSLARQAIRTGGTAPTVFNAANEVAVARFLGGEIGFLQIADVAERALNDTPIIQNPDIEDIFETDRKVRQGCL